MLGMEGLRGVLWGVVIFDMKKIIIMKFEENMWGSWGVAAGRFCCGFLLVLIGFYGVSGGYSVAWRLYGYGDLTRCLNN